MLLFASASTAHAAGLTEGIRSEQWFVTQAALASSGEIQLSQLAIQNTRDAKLRSFAERLLSDHQREAALLESVARKHGWTLPQRLDQDRERLIEKLKSLHGVEFDVAYAKAVEKDHDQIIDLLNRATHTEGLSTDLQTFAERALPTCKEHERMSDDLKHREVQSD